MASLTLRLPERDADKEHTLQLPVEPGQRVRVLALVRNQSGIVDNYTLGVDGLPADWWSVYPDTVYLVPFGTGGTYEQEVEIHIHPPRTPDAEAKLWSLKIVALSKAHETTAATAPLAVQIRPYVETTTKVRPERAKGRRKANYDVAIENKANAPVLVALEGQDPDDELEFGFNRPPQEIPAGHSVTTQMQVRPPKQLWVGRGVEKRFTVLTLTGEQAEERLAAEPVPADVVAGQGSEAPPKRGLLGRAKQGDLPGVYGPKIYKPQVYKPGVSVGPGGISLRKPQITGPKLQGPQMKGMQFDSSSLQNKLGKGGGAGGAAAAAPSAPLLPSQGVFRQKAWLPWWLIPILLLLVLLAVLLFLLLPKNVGVPDVVGAKSTFAAEKKLTEAGLKLNPVQKTQVDAKAAPGTVIAQTPKAGEKAKKGELVSVLIALGTGKIAVPKITGLTLGDAEKALRAKGLTLGQSSPQPPDPAGKISSQIPAEKEIVKAGTPVDVFFPDPNGKAKGKGKGGKGAAGAAAGAGGAGAAGGGGGGDLLIPAIAGAKLDAYAKGLGDEGLVPVKKAVFNAAPAGTLFATVPPGGSKAKAGDKVQLLVSAGFPELAFNDDKNVLLVNGATGKPLNPIAKSPSREKHPTWSPDGDHVAYIGGGRVFLKDMTKPDAPSLPLTGSSDVFTDPAWAPTTDLNLLALTHLSGNDTDLCLGQITKDGLTPQCIKEPQFNVGNVVHWSPDGKEILALGVKTAGTFGMVRWRSKKAFSPDAKDWGHGRFVTDLSKSNEGAIDAVLSPDGKQLAVVSNQGGGPFQLYLAKPNDYLLTSAKATGVQACKVAWRSDGVELVAVQADAICSQDVGSLVRLPVSDPKSQQQLNAQGDNPAFQPLTLGG
jgi:beta-lactam-binding protein with PASTA domain